MHPIRRRKKRPNYGVRSVELCRGHNGFGFTISGQHPCILSCIVQGSPAEKAGLRAGDYLVAVDGRSVSKVPHDEVVKLIGCTARILRLQIAENYYSDSSDDEALPVRPKPKYPHKLRNGQQGSPCHQEGVATLQNRVAKVVRDLTTGVMFEGSLVQPSACLLTHWELPDHAPAPPPRPYVPCAEEVEQSQFVVGYLGTIEIPKQLQPGSKLQIVCACIKKLRTEKRTPTQVLMTVYSNSIRLTDTRNLVLADYPASRVIFCSASSDSDRRFFGLVTSAYHEVDDEGDDKSDVADCVPSSSCHVFNIDPKIYSHSDHLARAETFKLSCSGNNALGECCGFPKTSDPILKAIKNLYIDGDQFENAPPIQVNSPHPSNASSTNSSNSDSGIGFRDECGNQSDRILVVDIQNQRLHIHQVGHDDSLAGSLALPLPTSKLDNPSQRLTVRAMPDPAAGAARRSCSPVSNSSCEANRCHIDQNDTSYYYPNPSPRFLARSDESVAPKDQFFAFNPKPPADYYYSNPPSGNYSMVSVTPSQEDVSVISLKSQDLSVFPYDSRHWRRCDGASSSQKSGFGSYISVENMSVASTWKSLEDSKMDLADGSKSHSVADFTSLANYNDNMSVGSHRSHEALLTYKLSPKVFGVPRPVVTHSLEDLTMAETPLPGRGQQWGSLQELRTFAVPDFQHPVPSTPKLHSEHEANIEETEREAPHGNVASWSSSFERLLEDPVGLQVFAEFLKKEFSHENIYFWVSCERYRHLPSWEERKAEAQAIYDKHLGIGAQEPVNVDSHARQVTQEELGTASETLFLQAQKQIFNLMKFDSYPRFLKSDLYKECLLREMDGRDLPFTGKADLDQGLQLHRSGKLKKSRSDMEDRRRKSLLPWHRKNRSKSKDRGESEYTKTQIQRENEAEDSVSIRSDVTSSRSSLASWDLRTGPFTRQTSVNSGEGSEKEGSQLCRIVLPDGATTVVQTRLNESVNDLVRRLLEKRGLNFPCFQVFAGNKMIAATEESSVLSNKEVRVEPRTVFRLDLPNRKTVGVKSKPGKTLGEVLRPVLNKYGYRIQNVAVSLSNEGDWLDLSTQVQSVSNQRVLVSIRKGDEPLTTMRKPMGPPATPSSLDEITNRVFEELLQGKAETSKSTRTNPSDQGSVKSEDWGSEHSSGIFGRFLRRDSTYHDKSKDGRTKSSKKYPPSGPDHKSISSRPPLAGGLSAGCSTQKTVTLHTKPPLIAKLLGQSDSDELYEGLKRAQRSRLEDQRGTEINFELPDFLKDKENAPQGSKKSRKLFHPRRDGPSSYTSDGRPIGSSRENLLPSQSGLRSTPSSLENTLVDRSTLSPCRGSLLNATLTGDSVQPTSLPPNSPCNNMPPTPRPRAGSAIDRSLTDPSASLPCADLMPASLPPRLNEPPPLPPKPKHLPTKVTAWRPAPALRIPGGEITNQQNNGAVLPTARTVYLDQPTSSFV